MSFLELMRRNLSSFAIEDGTDIRLRFSADCGVQKLLPGGKAVRGTLRLYTGTLLTFMGRLQDEMAGRLVSQMRDRLYSEFNEFVHVRAGGIVLDGGALILPSAPQPHLTALVAALVRSGSEYLGDEIVRVEPVLRRAHAMPLPLLIDSEDVSLFPELGREAGRRSRGQADRRRRPVPLAELGGRAADPAEIHWVVFPDFEAGGPTELVTMSESEALFRYAQAVLNLHIWSDRALILGREMLEHARIARLRVGSIPEATDILIEEVQRSEGRRT